MTLVENVRDDTSWLKLAIPYIRNCVYDMCEILHDFVLLWFVGQISVAMLISHKMEKIRALFILIYTLLYIKSDLIFWNFSIFDFDLGYVQNQLKTCFYP